MQVSVVIPSYNVGVMLGDCIESVLRQELQPCEVIIVDNGSTDGSIELAFDFQKSYPLLFTVVAESRRGAQFARNCGLHKATGDWVQFLDADDILLPKKLANQVNSVRTGVGFIAGAVIKRDMNGKDTQVPLEQNQWIGLFKGGGALGLTSSILWSRQALNAVNGWNVNFPSSQEYELMFRILKKNFLCTQSCHYDTIHRSRPSGQISAAPYGAKLIPVLDLQTQMLQFLFQEHANEMDVIRECARIYFRKFTHLRDKNPAAVENFVSQNLSTVITEEMYRTYPFLKTFKLRSDLLNAYRMARKRILKR